MYKNEPNSFIELLHIFKDMLLGVIGGLVAYLLKYQKGKELDINHPFSFSSLVINMILGGYVSYLVGSGLPHDFEYRDFVVGSVGVASYPILLFIENNFLQIILKKVNIEVKEKNEK